MNDLCGSDSEEMQCRNSEEWREFIENLTHTFRVLIRNDAGRFFVPKLLYHEYELDTDRKEFRREQRKMRDGRVNVVMRLKLKKMYWDLLLRLKFMMVWSMIRGLVDTILEGGDTRFDDGNTRHGAGLDAEADLVEQYL